MSATTTTTGTSLLDTFKNAGSSLLNTATDIYKTKLAADVAKAQAKATEAAQKQQKAALKSDPTKTGSEWYQAPWVIPAAIGAGVLVLVMVFRRR